MRARMSPEPVANRPPVGVGTGLGATDMTEFLWPCSMSCVWPVRGSQNWTPRSLEPERTHSESGVSATLRTKSCRAVMVSQMCAGWMGKQVDEETYPVALERLDAAAALERGLLGMGAHLPRGAQLPHLDGLVQTAADKLARIRREGDTVHAVLVAVGPFEALQEVAELNVPHPHALVEGARSHELSIGGDGHRRDAILNSEGQVAEARLQIPDPDGAIATAGCNGASVAGKVERIDVLVVARERGADLPGLDIPDLDKVSLPAAKIKR